MPGIRNSYASFGCAVFADNHRTYQYHQWACANNLYPENQAPDIDDCSCDNDDPLVEWTDPVTDLAPWYDPAYPDSADFLGAIILKQTGARASTHSRETADAFDEGTVLGPPRKRGRAIVLDLLILGTSCPGVDYGMEWLRRLFEDGICACSSTDPCEPCSGKQFTLRVFCGDADECDAGLRTWDSTGAVDGITPVEDDSLKDQCCVAQRVTVTIQTESPYSFSCEAEECSIPLDMDAFTRCYDWLADCHDCDDSCCDRCGYDALCTCYPVPDPQITLPSNECWCPPLQKIVQCCCIDDIGEAFDTALRIDIFSGYDPSNDMFTRIGMRNLTLRVFDNPDNLECITDEDSYEIWQSNCNELLRFEFQVAYIPSDATLTIDGRRNRIFLTCDGVCRSYGQVVTSTTGSIFPLIARCAPIMVCAEYDALNSQPSDVLPAQPSSMTINSYRRWFN